MTVSSFLNIPLYFEFLVFRIFVANFSYAASICTILEKAPFIGLLIPLTIGIIIQWYLQMPVLARIIILSITLLIAISYSFLPFLKRLWLANLNGIAINAIFIAVGAILIWQQDIRNRSDWFGNLINEKQRLVVTLIENPIQKTKSYKAEAEINYVIENEKPLDKKGRLILYF